ncbi:MAG: MaoC family dehydratase [Acholeplasmataceae bacterium]
MSKIKTIKIGDYASDTKLIKDEDVKMFAHITGDLNPIHLDDDFAKKSIFKQKIAHGAFVSAFFSNILGTKLPGEGTIYLQQDSKFIRPVYINDTITLTVAVEEIFLEKSRVKLSTTATNQNGEVVIQGHALVKIPD